MTPHQNTQPMPQEDDTVVRSQVPAAGLGHVSSAECPATERSKPTIQHAPGNVKHALTLAAAALAGTGKFFQNGGQIVALRRFGSDDVGVQEVSRTALYSELDDAAEWQHLDRRSGDWVRCEPPSKYCKLLSEAGEHPYIPVLRGVARQPHFRPDGSLCATPGYDVGSGFFGAFHAAQFCIPAAPSRTDAEAAAATLQDLVAEFPFASESDRSAALCAMLTAAVRISLPGAPMFHVRAPQAGSGKSYLCEVITAFATDKRSTPVAFPASSEECSKLLIAELLRSPAVIEFDNLTSDLLAHKTLCTALTSETVAGRVLGRSKIVAPSTRVLFLSSGNSVGPVSDMARRCITINLDAGIETPASRAFSRPNLLQDVASDRERFVAAALTVVAAWMVNGKHETSVRPLGSFGQWSAWCRQPLLWLGFADPAASAFVSMEADPDTELLRRFLLAVTSVFDTSPFMVRDLLRSIDTNPGRTADLLDVIQDIVDSDGTSSTRKRLGQWVKRQVGRVAEGRKLVHAPTKRNAQCYQVESVSSVSSGAPVGNSVSGIPTEDGQPPRWEGDDSRSAREREEIEYVEPA